MTERIRDFLRNRRDVGRDDGPCLVVDLDVVRDNYNAFAKALPDTRVFYAVKANPAPEVLSLLASLGSCFDTASVPEIEMALAAGATADRISFGNTIKKERDVARAYALGVRLYAVDCEAEVEKIARVAPGSRVFCRILSDCVGAEWPLSRKFGCEPAMAVDVLEHALRLGLEPYGVSFHVGSQQRNQHAWDRALASAASVFRECGDRGMNLSMVNLGGGFPTKYLKNVPTVKTYGSAIFRALRKHFGNRIPETIIEPGRGMVGNAGVIETEVVLVSKKSEEDDLRLRRRALRAGALSAAGLARDRRQSPDRGHRRLHRDLRLGGLQRLRAAEDLPHLSFPLPSPLAGKGGSNTTGSRFAGFHPVTNKLADNTPRR